MVLGLFVFFVVRGLFFFASFFLVFACVPSIFRLMMLVRSRGGGSSHGVLSWLTRSGCHRTRSLRRVANDSCGCGRVAGAPLETDALQQLHTFFRQNRFFSRQEFFVVLQKRQRVCEGLSLAKRVPHIKWPTSKVIFSAGNESSLPCVDFAPILLGLDSRGRSWAHRHFREGPHSPSIPCSESSNLPKEACIGS